MARTKREDVFSPHEIAVAHVMNRTSRRCFLLGDDPLTGRNYDHRKLWTAHAASESALPPALLSLARNVDHRVFAADRRAATAHRAASRTPFATGSLRCATDSNQTAAPPPNMPVKATFSSQHRPPQCYEAIPETDSRH
ncbi:MAG: hypothetical protein KDA85_04350 [Planctomycetaceae bacterium]|nr:hypothetical protein [Planctomycetaceae bacterium]